MKIEIGKGHNSFYHEESIPLAINTYKMTPKLLSDLPLKSNRGLRNPICERLKQPRLEYLNRKILESSQVLEAPTESILTPQISVDLELVPEIIYKPINSSINELPLNVKFSCESEKETCRILQKRRITSTPKILKLILDSKPKKILVMKLAEFQCLERKNIDTKWNLTSKTSNRSSLKQANKFSKLSEENILPLNINARSVTFARNIVLMKYSK